MISEAICCCYVPGFLEFYKRDFTFFLFFFSFAGTECTIFNTRREVMIYERILTGHCFCVPLLNPD